MTACTSAEAFLADAEETILSADAVLLDIYFKDGNGIEIARFLRGSGFDKPIIFMTVSVDHALDAYGVDAGRIKKKDVERVSPYGDYIWVLELTGNQILEALEAASAPLPEQSPAFAQVSGIEYEVHIETAYAKGDKYEGSDFFAPEKPGARVRISSIGGKKFDPEKRYRIATIDFTARGGDSYFVFTQADKSVNTHVLLVNGVCDYLEKAWGGIVNPYYAKPQKRVIIKEKGKGGKP